MNKLILIKYIDSNTKKVCKKVNYNTYEFFDDFKKYRFSPIYTNLVLEVKGKTYKEKSECLKNLAIEFQNFNMEECDVDFSMTEIKDISSWFYEKSKRFGLVKEFKENGII